MTSLEHKRDRALGSLIGLAIGDAVGTTLEFRTRGSFAPITDLVGGGPFGLRAGQWTDDTSMALCLADSLLASNGLNQKDLAERFLRWKTHGENSVNGRCFDIGRATETALDRFAADHNPVAGSTSARDGGNGSLMRLAPIAVRFRQLANAQAAAVAQSVVTHGAEECVDACAYFVELLLQAIDGVDKEMVLQPRDRALSPKIAAIARGEWRQKPEGQIASTGYVVHTLEAALWCVAQSADFREAVLRAANLGHDADTVAAVTGQLAGALWGLTGIPAAWLAKLAWRDDIVARGTALWDASLL